MLHDYTEEVKGYLVDTTEVTNAQFKKFLDDTGYRPKHPENFLKHWPDGKLPEDIMDHPVVYVDLDDAELIRHLTDQHNIFDGNSGPHYALIHKDSVDKIKENIFGSPIELVTFEGYGRPLIDLINDISNSIARYCLIRYDTVRLSCDGTPKQISTKTVKAFARFFEDYLINKANCCRTNFGRYPYKL